MFPLRPLSDRCRAVVSRLAVLAAVAALAAPAHGYVEEPYTLGRLVNESTHIVVMRVERVSKENNVIIYRKVRDLKGQHPTDEIKHNIGRGGFHPREWQTIMNWAEPGKTAIFMHNGGASETCIDNYWYQAYPGGEWWSMSHAEPYLLRSFAGKPAKLETAIAAMLAGQEVVVSAMADGDKPALLLAQAKMQRMRASLQLIQWNAERDFVGWGGGEDFRRLAGMPPFSHYSGLGRVDPGAGGVAVADIDGDGRLDFCLYGESRVVLMVNDGRAFNELSLPYYGGARSADWADFNGDGLPDLLLATPSGLKLFTNQGGSFKDESGGLPPETYYNATAARWLDFDGDGLPDILLANGFHGLRLYRNLGPMAAAKPVKPAIGPWHYIGPFDNAGGNGFDTVYPPETRIDLSASYAGKGGEKAVWREGKFQDGAVNNLAIFKPEHNNDVAVYLYREFNFSGGAQLPISLGSDDTLTVWLNGKKLLAENVHRACSPDQNRLTLDLRPGKNELLLKICQGTGEFAFYFSTTAAPEPVPPLFADISAAAGLGPNGVGGRVKGDHLSVADVTGDGKPDFLYSAGEGGVLALHAGDRFVEAKDTGLRFQAGGVAPVFGDFDGDGRLDLFVPQNGVCKLFRNVGEGKFVDATAASGDLARPLRFATSAAWADFSGGGRPDLVIGCLRGPNRVFRNQGDGKFVEATAEFGFFQRVFHTRGLGVADLNGNGALDLVLSNEGGESSVLLGADTRGAAETTGSE